MTHCMYKKSAQFCVNTRGRLGQRESLNKQRRPFATGLIQPRFCRLCIYITILTSKEQVWHGFSLIMSLWWGSLQEEVANPCPRELSQPAKAGPQVLYVTQMAEFTLSFIRGTLLRKYSQRGEIRSQETCHLKLLQNSVSTATQAIIIPDS